MSAGHPVKKLSAEVARKIAAGEVIDRPNAIVRELIDNAVDSGASSVSVEIEDGGIEKVRVVDNGSGMTKEDLASCARPHATSKISTETDLLKLSTLGFRGEALSSIAAVCRLSIVSGGWKMRASVTEDHIIEPSSPVAGTIVQSEGLFENFPARRLFLKRPAAEGLMCRATFVEKTLPRPDIAFSFTADGERKLTLEPGATLKHRFVQAEEISESESLFYEINGSDGKEHPDWSFTCVIGEPGVSRTSRKDILIFVNGRRIQEYSLVQAVEYGGQGYFPNGTYPVAALFVTMNPALVDFNIHPAKKEARFQDIAALHHGVSSALRSFFHQYTVKTMTEHDGAIQDPPTLGFTKDADTTSTVKTFRSSSSDARSRYFDTAQQSEGTSRQSETASKRTDGAFPSYEIRHDAPDEVSAMADDALGGGEQLPISGFRFIGSALGTFLIAEKDDTLYIIDKHAAHERILYNAIMAGQGKRQQLLVPYEITCESAADDEYLEQISGELEKAGFSAEKKDDGTWEVTSVPERWRGTEADLNHAVLDRRLEPSEVISAVAAMSACKAAVKDGYVLDDSTAAELAEEALALPDPHCPHGRPIWTTISREQLFALVKRT